MIMTKKILLLGKKGQLGQALCKNLSNKTQVLALGREDVGGDLTKLSALTRTVQDYQPDIIINAAAYTAVDKSEEERALAYDVNVNAVAVLAELAKKQKSWLIHYSTDYVFDGSGDTPWKETDLTQPINVYGKTKRAGEEAIQACCDQFIIFRSAWLYSVNGHNFLKTILQRAKTQTMLRVVDDQIGTPTGVELISHVTGQVMSQMQPEHSGIYHLTAQGYTSWYGFAQLIIKEAAQYQSLALEELLSMRSADYISLAKRPLNSRLNTHKLTETFNLHLPDWHVEAKQSIARLLQGNML